MLSKPNLLRSITNKKLLDNIRGIGQKFNWFPSTFKHGIAKPIYKILQFPIVNKLS